MRKRGFKNIDGINIKPRAALLLAAALILSFCLPALSAEAERASLTADKLDFDPATNLIRAHGNVHMVRPDGELSGDFGTGTTDGRNFEMAGNVKGRFQNEDTDIVCEYMELRTEGTDDTRRIITASGNVELTRGDDSITSDSVSWELDREAYRASGNVIGNYTNYYIDSDEASRDGDKFSAKGIRKYNDKNRRLTLSASRANGLFGDNGDIVELTAEGRVVMDAPDDKGAVTRITGDKGIFSVARGTLVISGNAVINQSGRNLHAASIVYHLDTERVEALGRPSLTIELPK